jgi:hypothetical protein
MTAEAFGMNLEGQFPSINDAVLAEIIDLIKQYSDDGRSRLWAAFRDGYDLNYPPRRGSIIKIAERIGIERQTEYVKWMLVCYICTARTGKTFKYPVDRMRCPICANHDTTYYALIHPAKETNVERARTIMARYSVPGFDDNGLPIGRATAPEIRQYKDD